MLALEEAYEALDERQRRSVVRVQAVARGWAQRSRARRAARAESVARGGCWARFSLPVSERLVEHARAHLGGPVASGTGDLYVTSARVCFYCDASDASERDGILFSPTKKRREGSVKPISLKISYGELAEVKTRDSWGEPGVTLVMRDGSSMWFGGFYFPSSIKAVIEKELERATVGKMESARALRAEAILKQDEKRRARERRVESANDEKMEELREEVRAEREKARRAEARERDAAVEIEVLRENEERMERQKKKLMGQVRDYEEECENLRHKANSANASRREAETKLRELECKFDDNLDKILAEKNATINELSSEVSRFKDMWEEDKSLMRAELDKARRQASELRDQRDALVSEKSKLTIEIGHLGTELTKFSEVSASESRRVSELESELASLRDAESQRESLAVKYDEAMRRLASFEARSDCTVTQAELQLKIDEIESLKAHCEALRDRMNKKVDDVAELRSKYDEAMEEISRLKMAQEEKTATKVTQAEINAAPAEIKALQAQIETLRSNLTEKSLANAKLQAKYEEAKNALCAARVEKDDQIKSASVELNRREMDLRTSLENKETKIAALEAEVAALHSTRESAAAVSATLKTKYEEAKCQIAALRAEKEELTKASANELNHRESSLRTQLGAATAKCDELQREIDTLRVQRESAAVASATLQSKYEETNTKLNELKAAREASEKNLVKERQELEQALVEAKETSAAALQAVQAERESMREAKEKSNMSLVSLKAKLEESSKQIAASKSELDLAMTAREEALTKMHDAQRGEEAAKVKLVEVEKNLVQRETEAKSLKQELEAFTSAAKAAETREREAREELQELRRQNDALLKEHGTLEGRSRALEEKANQLVEVEKEMSALKAELTATALQQEKWRQDVEYAKAEIERSRSKEEAHNEKYLDMLKNMSEAEREAASARAAESVARDYAARSSETAKETAEREVRMRDELATMRVAYETLSVEFRTRTEEFTREVARLERAVNDEENNVKVLGVKLDEAREKINNLEQLNIQTTNKLDKYKETLARQREETKQIYEAYQSVQAELDEKQRLLEREQTETRDMHIQKALEKQRSTAALLQGSRVGSFARQPLGDANRGSSPMNGAARLPGIPSLAEMLPSLARHESSAVRAIAAAPEPISP